MSFLDFFSSEVVSEAPCEEVVEQVEAAEDCAV